MSQTNTSDALSFIARTFAEAYYGLLVDAENFSKLHTFYQLDAVFTRGDEAIGQDDASTTTGLEGIKKELAVFHNQVRNSEVTLKVMDSQYSVNQGIVITAVGSFNRLEGATVKTRRFVQTFFLEAQTPNNYSIRNDILRYLNETSQQVVVAAKEEPKPQPSIAPAPTTANGTTEAHTTASVAESNGDAKKQPQDKKKPAAGSPTAARKARPTRKGEDKKSRETKSEQGQEQPAAAKLPKPTTYATIVSGNAAPAAPAAPVATKPKTAVAGAAPKKQAPSQQQGQYQQQQQQQQQARPLKEKKPKQEREGHSVYVGNLPFEATSDQVYNLFAKFGTIKDVALKRGYGFVDLTSAEDLKKVVDYFAEHPVELDGRPLVIEDRKRGAPAKSNAPRPQGQGHSQPKPAGTKRPKSSPSGTNKSNDNAAH